MIKRKCPSCGEESISVLTILFARKKKPASCPLCGCRVYPDLKFFSFRIILEIAIIIGIWWMALTLTMETDIVEDVLGSGWAFLIFILLLVMPELILWPLVLPLRMFHPLGVHEEIVEDKEDKNKEDKEDKEKKDFYVPKPYEYDGDK